MATYQTEAVVLLYTLFFGEEEEEALPLTVRPKSVVWRRNSDRSADEAVIEIDARAFAGLDPRAIYSMRVEVYVNDVRGRVGYSLAGDPTALRFVGFVDTPEFNRTSDSDTLRLTCRDYTTLFIDRQMPKDYGHPAGGGQSRFTSTEWSLDTSFYNFVQRLIANMEGEGDLFRDPPADAVALAQAQVRATTAAQLAAAGAAGGVAASAAALTAIQARLAGGGLFRRRLWIDPDVAEINLKEQFERNNLSDVANLDGSMWDVLNQVSDLLGVVPTIEQDWLWIKRPSDYHGGLYHFKWGKNIADLGLKKELTNGVSRKVFEVRALRSTMAPGEPRVVYGVWPQTTLTKVHAPITEKGGAAGLDDPSNAARGGSARGQRNQSIDDVVVRFLVDGDYTEEQLTRIARTYYEEAARQDLQGHLVSHECLDLGFTHAEEVSLGSLFEADGPRFLQRLDDEARQAALDNLQGQGIVEVNPFEEFDDVVVVEPTTPRLVIPQQPMMAIRNSSLIVLDLPPAPVANEGYTRQAGGVTPDPGFLAKLSQRAARVAAENATTVLYVKEAEHTWNVHDGYTVRVEFTSILGTDVGGPTAAAPTSTARET